ncbi:MAG: McrC family protein [Sulfurimonas sp.]|nr:McrC family protein [Sulfurimonas sp.]
MPIILKEYEFLQTKDINQSNEKAHYMEEKSFLELEKFILENETTPYLKIISKKGYGKILQAQNFVGVIQTKDGTTIEILPKILHVEIDESKKILLRMLKTLKKSPFKHINMANLKSSKLPLLEMFITMFLDELSWLIKRGIKSDYVKKQENLKFLKGKLKLSEQIKQNYIHKERFFVEYEEFSSDRAENRLIKTTLNFLYKKSKLNQNQQRIREFLFIFDDVSQSKDVKTDFANICLDRQMKDYEQVLVWSKTFLLENSFSPYKGSEIAFALLFDMNLLFESYVGTYLKKNNLHVELQDRGKYLVEHPRKFALKPDIVIDKDTSNEIIADTKYKVIKEEKDISQSDMYQLYAYGTKYKNCSQLYLIYPKGENIEFEKYSYIKDKLHLNVVFFDLSLKFEENNFIQKIKETKQCTHLASQL